MSNSRSNTSAAADKKFGLRKIPSFFSNLDAAKDYNAAGNLKKHGFVTVEDEWCSKKIFSKSKRNN